MESFLSSYGLLALFVGMLLEGELLLLSAIVLVKLGHLDFEQVLFVAFLGAIGHDWLFYVLGKTQEVFLFKKRLELKERILTFFSVFEKYPLFFFLFYRFLIGFRMIILCLFGIRKIPVSQFALISLFSNLLWIATYGVLGYYFADIVIENIELIYEYKFYIVGAVIFVLYIVNKKKRRQVK